MVGFKILGLWLLSSTLVDLARLPSFYQSPTAASAIAEVGLFNVLCQPMTRLVLGLALWGGARSLARNLPEPFRPTGGETLRAGPLLSAAIAAVGLVQVTDAIPAFAWGLTIRNLARQGASGWQISQAAPKIADGVTRLLIGVALLTGVVVRRRIGANTSGEFAGSVSEGDQTATGEPERPGGA